MESAFIEDESSMQCIHLSNFCSILWRLNFGKFNMAVNGRLIYAIETLRAPSGNIKNVEI